MREKTIEKKLADAARHRLLRQLGFKVYVLDGEDQIGGILDEICTP